jgi:hypothetical protein
LQFLLRLIHQPILTNSMTINGPEKSKAIDAAENNKNVLIK